MIASARWFHVGMGLASVASLGLGFGRSFYARAWSPLPPLAPLVIAHGIAFTSWILLFVAQAALVAAGRTALHRRLGLAGVVLGVLMLGSGVPLAIAAARRGALPGDPLAFLLVVFGDLVAFAVCLGIAIYSRRHGETHKRWMLLAMLSLLPPAVSRWPIAVNRPSVIACVLLAFLAAAPVYDWLSRRRLHPVSVWGGLALFASVPLRFAAAQTEAWHHVATWLIR